MINRSNFEQRGFAVVQNIYEQAEVGLLKDILDSYCSKFDQTKPVHAIRRAIQQIPELQPILWNNRMKALVSNFAGSDFFLTKAIYFDKPAESNWFVAYHQDLSISVSERIHLEGYKNWTEKDGQFGVQPPLEILDNIVTIRIHLDNTDETNGALRVIPSSHRMGVRRIQDISREKEVLCQVPEGGVMLMKPLTFHASHRSTGKRRRVLHLEFSNEELGGQLRWREKLIV